MNASLENFPVIESFLNDFPVEVTLRSHSGLPTELKAALEDLARGRLPEMRRDEVCRETLAHRQAVGFLAGLARKRQESGEVN